MYVWYWYIYFSFWIKFISRGFFPKCIFWRIFLIVIDEPKVGKFNLNLKVNQNSHVTERLTFWTPTWILYSFLTFDTEWRMGWTFAITEKLSTSLNSTSRNARIWVCQPYLSLLQYSVSTMGASSYMLLEHFLRDPRRERFDFSLLWISSYLCGPSHRLSVIDTNVVKGNCICVCIYIP